MTAASRCRVEVIVDVAIAGLRADQALTRVFPELSRRDVQRLCELERIWCGRRPLKKSELLQLGATLLVELQDPARASPNAQSALLVRFESRQWIVVCKPAGQPTAPRNSHELDALANALVAAYPELASVGHRQLEPGLLHRLDNGTSGLLVAARTAQAFDAATKALKGGQWVKRYLALVHGSNLPQAGTIAGRLVADRQHPQRVRWDSNVNVNATPPDDWCVELSHRRSGPYRPSTGHNAPAMDDDEHRHQTRFRVKRRLGTMTFVEVAVGAAFRHQIRAHFAAVGWPLVNDEVYGAPAEPSLAPRRHALHAARVAWVGDEAFAGFDVTEPLPPDLGDFLRVAGAEAT